MLKVRLMGTKNDIKWFGKILQRNPKIEVTEFSDMFPNKGTKKYCNGAPDTDGGKAEGTESDTQSG